MALVYTMTYTIPIDKAGRMVLPREIRKRFHLAAGDVLEAVVGTHEIRIRPRVAAQARLGKVDGRMVWDAPGASASLDEIEKAVGRGRDERDVRAAGL